MNRARQSPPRAPRPTSSRSDTARSRPRTVTSTRAAHSASPKSCPRVAADNYDALLLPGGTMNPDNLRQDPAAVRSAGDIVRAGTPVRVTCHRLWTLVQADVVRGPTLTSFPSLRTDLSHTGAAVVDEAVVVDNSPVSRRNPADLPAFCAAIVETFTGTPGSSRDQ
ncbi:DJ-1/PfpI family protein [Amycolatopsis sp. H20-H5]|uniref:DJ-1/PfpI family protein n=1 Tax=Amycolatopsis sp. H20-H5 TaxID=3046309 RepID=UPI002DB6D7D9|nr:DJ-1/PfpI family protein [Amycolatopsis sp. H20-H5]MEC3977406.1 DJ-1/PfpI family protein [Amycolatopsis sp. H20-H5]